LYDGLHEVQRCVLQVDKAVILSCPEIKDEICMVVVNVVA